MSGWRVIFMCLAVGVGLASGAIVGAQTAQSTSSPASGPAMIPYADTAFGFEMRVPAGWDYDRARFQQFKDSVGLLRGRSPGGQQALQVQIFRIQPNVVPGAANRPERVDLPSFEDWVIEFSKALAESGDAVPFKAEELAAEGENRQQNALVQIDPWPLPPRSGALLAYQTRIGANTARTLTLCMPFDASTVWVLVLTGVANDAAQAAQLRADCECIARTLTIQYDPADVQQLGAAFERGRKIIDQVRAVGSQVRLNEAEEYYDISLGGKGIGYLRRRIARAEHEFTSPGARFRDTRPGLRVWERSWRFADDGTVRKTRLDMFSSFDRQDELIEHQTTQIPALDVQPQQLLVKTDQVIRKKDVLFSSFTTNLDRTLPEPGKPLGTGPVYLDLAWVRVSPGLLLKAPPEAHAFAIYDTETRALSSQTMTPLGERKLEGVEGPVFAFEVREGLVSRPARTYTDARGTLLRMEAGDLVVRRVTKAEVEKAYGAKRDAAAKRFNLQDD